jgi:hypothetical protein
VSFILTCRITVFTNYGSIIIIDSIFVFLNSKDNCRLILIASTKFGKRKELIATLILETRTAMLTQLWIAENIKTCGRLSCNKKIYCSVWLPYKYISKKHFLWNSSIPTQNLYRNEFSEFAILKHVELFTPVMILQ